ncbi:Pentapeptide repeat protein Rfr32 [Porphyridium purpureum]|uniref:Pentapeptide repeat protein Rfr32 n=1 Tax=Porphyridium purpureum TaxID=35688 RepID=A0A5J4Z4D0_PORPP|nr:Pentapeptide repeat protein Rfr32 [Porphyridium purpureum]|eukprot:POR3431..scf208_2
MTALAFVGGAVPAHAELRDARVSRRLCTSIAVSAQWRNIKAFGRASLRTTRRVEKDDAVAAAGLRMAAHDAKWKVVVCVAVVAATLGAGSISALAISGGGKEYASGDWSGKDFTGGSFVGKDWSGSICVGTIFKNSDLRGARFFKANLRDADFNGAKMAGASLEGAQLKGASFNGADLSSAYFSDSMLEAESFTGADLSEALFPQTLLSRLCARPDVSGTNKQTGVDTRESIMCPD